VVYERVRDSYDRVAERYADEMGGELAGKPLDRALLRCLIELVATVEETSGSGMVADLGSGAGHVAAYLAAQGVSTTAIDISPTMVEVGRRRYPDVGFRVGSLLALPATDGELVGAVALYSIIHLEPEDRPAAYQEMARVIRTGGWLLVAFHTSLPGHPVGDVMHADLWWGEQVDLDFHYIDPTEVVTGITAAGFTVMARTDREPWPGVEGESQRTYLLCRRN
jgi:ubiquinone/menaquinone biosynthesis C-methylase UbiE